MTGHFHVLQDERNQLTRISQGCIHYIGRLRPTIFRQPTPENVRARICHDIALECSFMLEYTLARFNNANRLTPPQIEPPFEDELHPPNIENVNGLTDEEKRQHILDYLETLSENA